MRAINNHFRTQNNDPSDPQDTQHHTYLSCQKMSFKGHDIKPMAYHIGNSQISFHSTPETTNAEYGRISSIIFAQEVQKYFVFVQPFKPLGPHDVNRDPFKDLDLQGATLVYQELMPEFMLLSDQIEGHIATLAYQAKESRTVGDTFCVVKINFYVSFFHLHLFYLTLFEL